MQANRDFLSPVYQCMANVEIVLISKHQLYLQLPDGSFGERAGKREGNYSVERKRILKQQRNKNASPRSTVSLKMEKE